jgi:hypothetical protein
MVKPIDRVHGVVGQRRGRVHGGPSGGTSLVQGTPGAAGLWRSRTKAVDEEGNEALLVRGSPRHE